MFLLSSKGNVLRTYSVKRLLTSSVADLHILPSQFILSPFKGTQEPKKLTFFLQMWFSSLGGYGQWALCRIVITWYKSAILGRKLRTGTSKTKLANLNFLCFRCPSGQFASQYGGFVPCDHYLAKGPFR